MEQKTKHIKVWGIDMEVTYYYSPEESQTLYYPDGSGYSGMPADVDIIKIKCDNICEILDNMDNDNIKASEKVGIFYDDVIQKILEIENDE